MMKFLIETPIKSQGSKALRQIVQQGRLFATQSGHFCNPRQWELFIFDVASVGKTQGSQQIDGHVGSRNLCPLTPKSLLLQTLIQCKLWLMGHNQPEGPACMELCPKSTSTNPDRAWSLTHSRSTCILHSGLAPQALWALLPRRWFLPLMRRRLFCAMGAARKLPPSGWRSSHLLHHCHDWV